METLPSSKSPAKLIIVILVLAIVCLVSAIGYLVFGKIEPPASTVLRNSNNSQISGNLNINGVAPDGSSITLTQKIAGDSSEPVSFVDGLLPHDGNFWQLNNAEAGKSYEIQAKLMQGNNEIAFSSPIFVTSPATDEVLTLNIESETNTPTAVISGNIIVNGYIPNGATIDVQGRQLGGQNFTTIANNLPGQPRQFLSYSTALVGATYEVIATLYASDGSTILGSSPTLTVTAPAVNESLTINSSAVMPPSATPTPLVPTLSASTPTPTPVPAPQAIIGGSIDFNGVAAPNTRIVIFQKVYNSSNYIVAVDNINPVNGSTWQWSGPQPSTWYDMIAVLKQRQSNGSDIDLSTTPMQSVAAPATNVVFTLNSSYSLNAPGGPISVNCGNESGNTWNAQVTFTAVNNAQSYWYQIGTSNGGSQLTNATQNASGNSNLTVNVSLTNGTTYYANYAYANLPNLGAGNSQFSPFSSTQQIQCGN